VPEVLREVPVVEFRILGALHLLGADGRELTSVLAQPKRVALLAYLAAATPPRLHRRDSLVALFWPELDQEHARAALRQALHGLRQALGDGVLVTRGDEDIGLDREQIRCDVVEFERSTEAGRLADALDLYRGDLLEGFFIRGAPEFEQWLEDERARLKAVALRNATLLAERSEGHGALAEAAQWSRRALRIAPLDEPALRRLMKTLDRLGDRAGALDAYETFAKRLTAELEAEPAPETQALAGAVRARAAPLASAVAELLPLETAAELQNPAPGRPTRGRGRRARIVAGAIAAMVLLAGAAATVRLRRLAQATAAPPIRLVERRVAVAPFENHTRDRALEPIGHLTSDWITQGLAEAGFVEIVDPQTVWIATGRTPISVRGLASATGARLIVSGAYYLEGDSLRFLARVTDASEDKLLRVIGPVTAVAATQGQAIAILRERVLGAVGGLLDVRSGQYAALSGLPPSLAAYQRWSLGVEHFYKNEFAQAGAAFLASARADSTFVLPLLWGAGAYINTDSLGKADSLLRVADRSRDRLSPSDRYLLDVKRAELRGDFTTGLETAREMLRASPGSGVAIAVLAWDALRANRPREGIAALRRADPERPPARQYPPYWDVLTRLEHLQGDYSAEVADAMHGRRQYPDRLATLSDEARALAALGKRADVWRRLDEVIDLPWDPLATPGDVMREIGTELRAHGDGPAADSAFTRALRWYADRPFGEQATVAARAKVAMTLYVAGRWDDARRLFERLAREEPRDIEYRGYLGVLAARRGDQAEARAVERKLRGLRGPWLLGRHTYWRARIAALMGERERAVTLLRESLQQGREYFPAHVEADFETLRALPSFRGLMRAKE